MSKGYHLCLDDVTVGRLKRVAAELGRSVEDLIEIAAEEAALEYAKSRGWPLNTQEVRDHLRPDNLA